MFIGIAIKLAARLKALVLGGANPGGTITWEDGTNVTWEDGTTANYEG